MAWKQDAFQHSWNHLSTYAFPRFTFIRQVLSRALLSTGLSFVLVAPCWPRKEWFANLLSLLVDKSLELLFVWDHLVQPHVLKFHHDQGTLCLQAWKLSSDWSERQVFWGKIAKVVAANRHSTAALYQSKWSQFFH